MSTGLLHLGQVGSSSESKTYMKHLGHPARTMEVASCSCSDDRKELGDDENDDPVGDRRDVWYSSMLGGDKFSCRSS